MKGYLVGVRVVRENHEVMLQSRDGVVIRMRADGISKQGRTATGVRVMNLREGDVVSAVAKMVVSEIGRHRRGDRGGLTEAGLGRPSRWSAAGNRSPLRSLLSLLSA